MSVCDMFEMESLILYQSDFCFFLSFFLAGLVPPSVWLMSLDNRSYSLELDKLVRRTPT